MNNVINVAFSANEKFIKGMYVALTSLFENNKDDHICVYILHSKENMCYIFDELAEKYKQRIFYLEIDLSNYENKLPHNDYWPMEIYYRLALPEVLPTEVERILYLDADVIILNHIGGLYHMDLQGKSIGACKDMGVFYGTGSLTQRQLDLIKPFMEDEAYDYFNSGVLLMDIAKMRREGKDIAFFVETGEKIADNICGDQDILNYVYHDDVVYADAAQYNIFTRVLYNMGRGYEWVKEHGTIAHFCGRKPWQHEAIRYNTEKLFWDYAKMTPYYTELLEQVVIGETESGFIDSTIKQLEQEKLDMMRALQKCMDVLKNLNRNK